MLCVVNIEANTYKLNTQTILLQQNFSTKNNKTEINFLFLKYETKKIIKN